MDEETPGGAAADAIEIAWLAAMPPLECDRQLKRAAKRLNVSRATLGAEVRKARRAVGADGGGQARPRALPSGRRAVA